MCPAGWWLYVDIYCICVIYVNILSAIYDTYDVSVVRYMHILYTYSTHTDICVFHVAMSLVGACPVGWLFYETTLACFYMSTETMSQAAAYAECERMDAELASFSDQAEMDFVTSLS